MNLNNPYLLRLWAIDKNAPKKPITDDEKNFAISLSNDRKEEYIHSRGYVREVLSKVLGLPPLEVPIFAPPGKPPILKESLGFISLSHCDSLLVISWSFHDLGIDVENQNRIFDGRKLIKRFFLENECKNILNCSTDDINANCLKYWVLKEASIKLLRGKLFRDLEKIEIINDDFANYELDSRLIKIKNIYFKNYIIGIASWNEDILKDIKICIY